jgi:arsenate reductase (thioredoxin)
MDLTRTHRILVSLASVALLASGVPWAAAAQARPAVAPKHVLFMCPHGAAKSVLASAYFQRKAKERGLNVIVTSAGTEPDATVAPAVAAHLARQGYPSPTTAPRKATDEDLAKADLVISLGCDLSGLPKPRGSLVRWDDIPSPSADFTGADDAIRAKVDALVDELAREGVPAKP